MSPLDRGLPADAPRDERFLELCGRASRVLGALVFFAGFLNFLLWRIDRTLPFRISPHAVPMVSDTAIACALSGLSLRAASRKAGGRCARGAGDACALAAASIGILALVRYASGWEPDWTTGWGMAPVTALIFSLLGASLLLGRHRPGGIASSGMALAAGFLCLSGIIGHAFDSDPMQYMGGSRAIALSTSLTGLALAAGVLFAFPDRGPVRFLSLARTGSVRLRKELPAVIFLPVLFGLLRHLAEGAGWIREGTGLSLMVLFVISALAFLLSRDALLLNRADRERERADRLREHREKELAETAAILDRVFSNIHLQIAYMDSRFRFLRVNQEYAKGAGRPPEYFIGKSHFDLFPHEENERIFRRVVETGEPCFVFSKPFEHPNRPEEGTTYWDWSLQPVKEADGSVAGLIFSLIEVTERVLAEQRLRRQEETAIQQEKLALLGQMAAGIVHEIRNPLSGMSFCLAAAECLSEAAGELEPGTREKLVRMIASSRAASEKIGEVVRRVMTFARPGPPAMKPVDVNEAVREAAAIASPTLRKSGIRLETALSGDLPACMADLGLLEQLILNLVNNAAQATASRPEGERRIEIVSRREGEDVLLAVADSGTGVPEAIREKIFEPFFTTRPEGTGLGLAISRRIVSDHRGTMEIVGSRLGGAEFRVILPAASGANAREDGVNNR